MARKQPRLQRVLDAPELFSVAYGEIASSIYFALGIIAAHALGFTPPVLLARSDALTHGLNVGSSPTWHALLFALPLAMLAYTGLETVANMAEEARSPGVDLPRSLFSGIGLVVLIYVAIGLVALSAFPADHGTTQLGTRWLHSPMMGIVAALHGHVPDGLVTALRLYVGLTGAVILLVAITRNRIPTASRTAGVSPSAFCATIASAT